MMYGLEVVRKLEALQKKATAGNWRWQTTKLPDSMMEEKYFAFVRLTGPKSVRVLMADHCKRDDADFIIALNNHLSDLLGYIKLLENGDPGATTARVKHLEVAMLTLYRCVIEMSESVFRSNPALGERFYQVLHPVREELQKLGIM